MRNQELVSGREWDVIVVLQDGRQLDGWMHRFENALECQRVVFAAWEIDEVFPQ